MTTYIVTTESGSTYRVCEENDRFFLRANNVPNPNSVAIPDREWEVVPQDFTVFAWPPVVGQCMYLSCIHELDRDHPDRMPGGGKITSRVKEIVIA